MPGLDIPVDDQDLEKFDNLILYFKTSIFIVSK
jgi:hypothetical protein